MAAMNAPVVHFRQRNNLARLALTLYPDYAEYSIAGTRSKNTGFNVKYELLPKPFDYRTFRPADIFVIFPLFLVASLTLFEAATTWGNAYSLLGVMLSCGLTFCGISYGLRRLLKKEYTALATTAGTILIAKDDQHDLILAELQGRRAAALKNFAVVNPLVLPWSEIKKFKWLRDEAIISDHDFRMYRELILSSAESVTEKAAEAPALH
jgi:hypothetical protein